MKRHVRNHREPSPGRKAMVLVAFLFALLASRMPPLEAATTTFPDTPLAVTARTAAVATAAPGSPAPPPGPTAHPAGLLPPPSPAVGTVTLLIWTMSQDGWLLREPIREFEQQNPGVDIVVQAIPWATAHEKLVTAVVGSMTPDIAEIGSTWMAEFVAMDALAPLNPWLATGTFEEEDFFPGLAEGCRIGSTWFGLPWLVDTTVLFYRRDHLASVGCQVFPRTWSEFDDLCGRLKAHNPTIWPLSIETPDANQFLMLVRQRGGEFLAEGQPHVLGPPAVVAGTLQWFRDLHARQWIFYGMEGPPGETIQQFVAGSVTMALAGPGQINLADAQLQAMHDQVGAARLPKALHSSGSIGGCNLAVFRNSPHPELAWRFLSFVLGRESMLRHNGMYGALPPRRSAWEDPRLATETLLLAFREQLEDTRISPAIPEWGLIEETLRGTIDEVMRGHHTPGSATTVLDGRLRAILERSALWQPRLTRVAMLAGVVLALLFALGWYLKPEFTGLTWSQIGEKLTGPMAFFLPALILLTVFRFVPILGSFLVSLTNWDLYGVANLDRVMFTGLDNYRALLDDTRFWLALRNTLVFAAVGVPLNILLSLSLALALFRVVERAQTTLRTGFFLPVVTTIVVASIVWCWIFDRHFGPLNRLLTALGLPIQDWLYDPRLALFSLVVVAVWKGLGYNLVIFFVARQGIDESLYESAELDGASRWQQFRFITLPMMRRVTTFAAVVTGIGFLQVFSEPYLITGGGPADSTMTLVLYLYIHGFRYFRIGYASAVAFALFLCTLGLILIRSHLRRALEAGR